MSSWGRTASVALAGLVWLSGCGGDGDAPLGSAPPLRNGTLLRSAQHLDSGLAALSAGDFAQAEAQAAEMLRARPDDPYALLALAMVHERTGRTDLARQHYQVIRVLDPQGSVMLGGEPPQPLAELARAGLRRLGGADGAQPAFAGPDVSPENTAQRFRVLRGLLDRGLVTEQEFSVRRNANLGALLPYSESPPAAALDWAPPSAEQVAQRLRAIAAGLEGRTLTPGEHAAEREVIIDALLPAQPKMRNADPAPALDARGLGEHLAWLQSLRGAGLITPEEQARDRAAAERATVAAVTPAAPSATAAPKPLVPAAPVGTPSAKPDAKAAAKPAKSGSHTIHLASLRSEKMAREGWASLRKKHAELLSGLDASFTRVELPGKGVFWRVGAGPLPDAKAAEALCRKLKAKGQFCDPRALGR